MRLGNLRSSHVVFNQLISDSDDGHDDADIYENDKSVKMIVTAYAYLYLFVYLPSVTISSLQACW